MNKANYLEMAGPMFLHRMRLIKWEAAQWMQYVGFEWDKKTDNIVLKFKSSSYGIMFHVEISAFSPLYGDPYIEFNEAYQFFKDLKLNKAVKQ